MTIAILLVLVVFIILYVTKDNRFNRFSSYEEVTKFKQNISKYRLKDTLVEMDKKSFILFKIILSAIVIWFFLKTGLFYRCFLL